jgi:hypothetical protein
MDAGRPGRDSRRGCAGRRRVTAKAARRDCPGRRAIGELSRPCGQHTPGALQGFYASPLADQIVDPLLTMRASVHSCYSLPRRASGPENELSCRERRYSIRICPRALVANAGSMCLRWRSPRTRC